MIEILNNDKERWSKDKELMLSKKQLKVYVCKEKFELISNFLINGLYIEDIHNYDTFDT